MPEFTHTIVSLNGDVSGRCRLEASASVDFAPAPARGGLAGLRSLGRDARPAPARPAGDLRLGRDRRHPWRTTGGTSDASPRRGRLSSRRGAGAETSASPGASHRVPTGGGARRAVEDLGTPRGRLVVAAVPSGSLHSERRRHRLLHARRRRSIATGTAAPAGRSRRAVIGTVGMLRPDKNHARLLRLFADFSRRRPARLVVVGEGPCRPELEKLASELGIAGQVCFTGAEVDPVMVLSCLRRLRALVGHRADAAVGSRSDGVGTSGGQHRRGRCRRDDRAAVRWSGLAAGDDDRLLEQLERFAADDGMRRAAGAEESRESSCRVQPWPHDRVVPSAVLPLSGNRAEGGLRCAVSAACSRWKDRCRRVVPRGRSGDERRVAHRGPDGDGFDDPAARRSVTAGSRSSIAPAAHQPMSNEDGTCWIVFNGEIYNHRDVAAACSKRRGIVFRTRPTRETILHAYEEFGPACVDRLEGMFAFAIYDERRRELFAARDRLGKKPFFYTVLDGVLHFASELPALSAIAALEGRRRPDGARRLSVARLLPRAGHDLSRCLQAAARRTGCASPTGASRPDGTGTSPSSTPITRRARRVLDEIDATLAPCRARSARERGAARCVSQRRHRLRPRRVVHGRSAWRSTGHRRPSASAKPQHNELDSGAADRSALQEPATTQTSIRAALWTRSSVRSRWAAASRWPTRRRFRRGTSRGRRGEHVTVALSGDGGDETFAGYDFRYVPHATRSARRGDGCLARPAAGWRGWTGRAWPRGRKLPKPLRAGTLLENLARDPAAAYYADLAFSSRPDHEH